MNAFNRAFMVLLSLALALAGLAVFVVTAGMVTTDTVSSPPEFVRAIQSIHSASEGAEPVWTGSSFGALLLGLILFIAELPLRRPRPKQLTLQSDASGVVTVSVNGLRRLSERVAGAIPGIEQVETDARVVGKQLNLDCHLQLAPETNAPDLAAAVRQALSASMEQHIGRPPARIDVHTQVGRPTAIRKRVR